MLELDNYSLIEKVHESDIWLVYKGRRKHDNHPVRVKFLNTQLPEPSDIECFTSEINDIQTIDDFDGVIRTFDIIHYSDGVILVQEDQSDAITLKEYITSGPVALSAFFEVAVSLAETIGRLHKRGIIHKNINPGSVVLQSGRLAPKLTNFGISHIISLKNERFRNPMVAKNVIRYMSPEQTGRMNRAIDYRTDMYSLGITFYEMLTGRAPFEMDDPAELIHAHMAKEPLPPSDVDEGIPRPVSDIVMKLMSKPVEDRYQSMYGLLFDLNRCNAMKGDDSFKVGRRDIPPQFSPPAISIGRESEKELLLSTIDQSRKSERLKIIMVTGYPGVGKSFLIDNLKKNMPAGQVYFISSHFHQEQGRLPYRPIIEAFSGLFKQLLAESPENIETWKALIQEALGMNGKIITDLIPLLTHIIGEQPDIPELAPEDSLNRIRYLFRNLLSVFAQPKHPLILFLDDLHFADPASVQFIESMLKDTGNMAFTFIGAYRHNEIDPQHRLSEMIEAMNKTSVHVVSIHLDMLSDDDILTYAASCLHVTPEDVAPLVPILKKKTSGEPFFINQFLGLLYDKGLIDPKSNCDLNWDLDTIQSLHMTDNVIDLMSEKIKDLPPGTRQLITCASCINHPFGLSLLSEMMQAPQTDIQKEVDDAVHRGLLIILDAQTYDMHDKFRKVAYALIPEEKQTEYHLTVGRYLIDHLDEYPLDQTIFHIVNHMNDEKSAITDPKEKNSLARLNLIAGIKAKSSGAYASAFDFFRAGIAFLDDRAWDTLVTLTYDLYANYAEAAYLTAKYDVMDQCIDTLLERVDEPLKQVWPCKTRILSLIARNRYNDATHLTLPMVKVLGVDMPDPMTQEAILEKYLSTAALIENKTDEDIINSGLMTDPVSLAIIDIMTYAIPAMHGSGYINESVFLTLEIARLSIEKGNAPQTPYWFSCYAMTLFATDQFHQAFRFSDLAVRIKNKYGFLGEARTDYMATGLMNIWHQPFQNCITRFRTIPRTCLELGDIEFGCWSMSMLDFLQWACGKELNALQKETATHIDTIRRLNIQPPLYFILVRYQAIENLLGHANSPTDLEGSMFSREKDTLKIKMGRGHMGLFLVHFFSMYLNFLFGNVEQASVEMDQAKIYQSSLTGGFYHLVLFHFFRCMIRIALIPQLSDSEKDAVMPKIEYSLNKLKKWNFNGSTSIQNKIDLVEAERYRINEDWINAQDSYEKSIKNAHSAGFIHEEALSYETAALFYESRNMMDFAKVYMVRSCACYEKWGARAKVEHIWKHHAHLLSLGIREVVNPNQEVTFYTTEKTAMMDMEAVMKASQAISGEIVLSNLLKKLIFIGIENAGAQRGALVSDIEGTLFVEAVSDVNGNIDILSGIPLKAYDKLPASVINYVHTICEDIMLDNAAQDERFSRDPYIIENKTKSLMCISIRHQNKTAGVFYLENNLNYGIFTPDRLTIIRLLFSQAAISLENARLFKEANDAQDDLRVHRDHLEEMVLERTKELKSIQRELIESAHLAGKADVASGVLHNVGNVLNSVCTSLHNMETLLHSSGAFTGYARANALLAEHMDDIDAFITENPKGKKLLHYYLSLGELLDQDISRFHFELNRLNEKTEVITNIIDAQQSYASAQGLSEKLPIIPIVEDALTMQAESIEKHHITVIRDFHQVPEVMMEKTKLIHVLINLFTNAKDSLIKQPIDRRKLTISVYSQAPSIFIAIKDTGEGIQKDQLKTIFSSGFTTKPTGHGFGLHSSANYMTEMGGKLWAESDGPGQGATFLISLPMSPPVDQ